MEWKRCLIGLEAGALVPSPSPTDSARVGIRQDSAFCLEMATGELFIAPRQSVPIPAKIFYFSLGNPPNARVLCFLSISVLPPDSYPRLNYN